MNDIKEIKKMLKAYCSEITSGAKLSKEFLIRVGIFNEDGELTEPYKNLSIPTMSISKEYTRKRPSHPDDCHSKPKTKRFFKKRGRKRLRKFYKRELENQTT